VLIANAGRDPVLVRRLARQVDVIIASMLAVTAFVLHVGQAGHGSNPPW
jgi:hypothetical protein